MSNKTRPEEVFVSNNGEYAVSLDNWESMERADNVLAFYDSNGLIRKYSLEEIFGPITESLEYFRNKLNGSRWWRHNSIEFFDEIDGFFCIWIDWEDRWLAWEQDSGNPVDASKEQVMRWNTKAREKMLSLIEKGEGSFPPYEFLGKLKVPQDRPLIEELLKDIDFSIYTDTVNVGDKAVNFRYCSSSGDRVAGDWILACWENLRDPREYVLDVPICGCPDEKYTFLGSLNLTVSYAKAPRKGEGSLRIYVIPSASGANEPQVSKADAYLIADLEYSYPYYVDNKSIVEMPNQPFFFPTAPAKRYLSLGKTVKFSIQGITPGRHKVVAIWDRAEPFCPKGPIECIAQKGDYISSKNPEVIIKAGETVENVKIYCTKLVK